MEWRKYRYGASTGMVFRDVFVVVVTLNVLCYGWMDGWMVGGYVVNKEGRKVVGVMR